MVQAAAMKRATLAVIARVIFGCDRDLSNRDGATNRGEPRVPSWTACAIRGWICPMDANTADASPVRQN